MYGLNNLLTFVHIQDSVIMNELEKVYNEILDSLDFDESSLDYSILDKHIECLSGISGILKSSVTIYDTFKREHVFASLKHKEMFGYQGYGDVQVHPEDYEAVFQNAIASMRHFFSGNKKAKDFKLIREYRVDVNGTSKRVTEQMQVIETDSRENPWLSLCIMDFSPNQSAPYRVNSKLLNTKTGDFITPVDSFFNTKTILSEREVTILKMIHDGLLSKEISDKLHISVHTVNTHRQRILEKLKVDTSIEAVKYALALGLLDD